VCDLGDKHTSGRRQITFLIYLVGMPEGESGGGTRFPELQLTVAPEQGSAIVFNDCHDNGEEDGRSLHAGCVERDRSTCVYTCIYNLYIYSPRSLARYLSIYLCLSIQLSIYIDR